MLPLDFAHRGSRRGARGSGAAQPRPRRPRRQGRPPARRSSPAASSSAWRSPARSRLDPKLVVGDEPTGNLDTHTAAEMFELLHAPERRGQDGALRHARPRARRARRTASSRSATALVVARVRTRSSRSALLQQVGHRPDAPEGADGLRDPRPGDRRRERRHLRAARRSPTGRCRRRSRSSQLADLTSTRGRSQLDPVAARGARAGCRT